MLSPKLAKPGRPVVYNKSIYGFTSAEYKFHTNIKIHVAAPSNCPAPPPDWSPPIVPAVAVRPALTHPTPTDRKRKHVEGLQLVLSGKHQLWKGAFFSAEVTEICWVPKVRFTAGESGLLSMIVDDVHMYL